MSGYRDTFDSGVFVLLMRLSHSRAAARQPWRNSTVSRCVEMPRVDRNEIGSCDVWRARSRRARPGPARAAETVACEINDLMNIARRVCVTVSRDELDRCGEDSSRAYKRK